MLIFFPLYVFGGLNPHSGPPDSARAPILPLRFQLHCLCPPDSNSSTIMVLRRFSGVTQRRRCLCGTATATLESQNDVVSWGKTNENPHVAVLITVRVVVTWAKGLMNAELLDIMFHHGGNFERGKDGRWTYTPDNRHCLGDLDVDRLDVFYLRNYFKELGYETMKEVWWQVPGMSLEVGLRRLDCDNELRELCNHGGKNNGVVDVYIEHGISEPEIVQGEDVVVHVDDEVRDLGEQAKSNARMVKDPPVKPTTEKDPPRSLSMSQPKPKSKCKPKTVPKPKPMPRQNNVTRTRRYCLRSVGKGISKAKENASDHVLLSSDSDSHDSYESAEDEAYKPQEPDDSSDESGIGYTVPSQKKMVKKPNARKKVQAESAKEKGKAKVCVDDDGFVEDVSDEDVDIGFVGGGIKGDNHDAFDPGSESDGGNSWHSLEMKTPPNSEDELVGEESSEDVFPVFRQGARFGELHLEVGMKFNTKWEFKEAVREFTIQEGRRMRFRKNDGKRVRAVCKVKDCKWVVYASRDHEDSCWQVKTFFNDHTCPREDKNRAANRNWVAGTTMFTEVTGEPATRPAKLPTRRRSPPTTPSTALDPMKGASSATASRFTNFLKFVPTPGFKHPRKK
ncbi:hypothetical protein Ahy_B01g055725 isoform A [Arachis hypogaea]|uniref:Uncharacterized protein n=2 Tax=Arachis hypogaea TaxID=3818 RepID=A0A445AWY2_ARAHY|nr:hypothetical protein Ahy_B01g055725 isoform A [Arachis hypogaea]